MADDRSMFIVDGGISPPSLTSDDRRAEMARAQELLLAERQQRLLELAAPSRTPEERISLWERTHQLSLPQAADHKLVPVIARLTGLTVEQVMAEQLRRRPKP